LYLLISLLNQLKRLIKTPAGRFASGLFEYQASAGQKLSWIPGFIAVFF
jgi:hypothetical protein